MGVGPSAARPTNTFAAQGTGVSVGLRPGMGMAGDMFGGGGGGGMMMGGRGGGGFGMPLMGGGGGGPPGSGPPPPMGPGFGGLPSLGMVGRPGFGLGPGPGPMGGPPGMRHGPGKWLICLCKVCHGCIGCRRSCRPAQRVWQSAWPRTRYADRVLHTAGRVSAVNRSAGLKPHGLAHAGHAGTLLHAASPRVETDLISLSTCRSGTAAAASLRLGRPTERRRRRSRRRAAGE